MPDGGEILATRVAFLELKDERRLIQEGYELLDEKRVLLATEIMRQLRHYAALQAELQALGARRAGGRSRAPSACTASTTSPSSPSSTSADADGRCTSSRSSACAWSRPRSTTGAAARTARASLDARSARLRQRLPPLRAPVELAACVASLRRLVREYVRTERRARALENVVLPEIDESLRFIEEQLDALDQEEAVRVRNAAAAA